MKSYKEIMKSYIISCIISKKCYSGQKAKTRAMSSRVFNGLKALIFSLQLVGEGKDQLLVFRQIHIIFIDHGGTGIDVFFHRDLL